MTLVTDKLDIQVGFVLVKKYPQDATEAINFWSHSLSDVKRKNDTTNRKFQAIEWSGLILHPYLQENLFCIYTDRESFNWIFRLADSTER